MNTSGTPKITICVLTFGDYAFLARRCLESIRTHCKREDYKLFVGCNAVSEETTKLVQELFADGAIDRLYRSEININKCPMMRYMFRNVESDFIWWLDDDSYITDKDALAARLKIVSDADSSSALWGHQFFAGHQNDFNHGENMVEFVKRSQWYRGKAPPSWDPGGKEQTNFDGNGGGDGRWFFITGGCWIIRTSAVRELDWPPPSMIKCADDVLLSEAIRQHDLYSHDIGPMGVETNAFVRRGEGEDAETMRRQLAKTG